MSPAVSSSSSYRRPGWSTISSTRVGGVCFLFHEVGGLQDAGGVDGGEVAAEADRESAVGLLEFVEARRAAAAASTRGRDRGYRPRRSPCSAGSGIA